MFSGLDVSILLRFFVVRGLSKLALLRMFNLERPFGPFFRTYAPLLDVARAIWSASRGIMASSYGSRMGSESRKVRDCQDAGGNAVRVHMEGST